MNTLERLSVAGLGLLLVNSRYILPEIAGIYLIVKAALPETRKISV